MYLAPVAYPTHAGFNGPYYYCGYAFGYPAAYRYPATYRYPAAYQGITRSEGSVVLKDYGKEPLAIDIEAAAEQNDAYRTALWTGDHLQVTLMSIGVGGDIGLEVHPDTDQFIRIEEGRGVVRMGKAKGKLDYVQPVSGGYAIMVPAGTWHNLVNTGDEPLKIYTIYAPPHHPPGTVHKTKADAMAAE
ncbi:cupin domain-containing protein [Cohnella sp.]|uniref:cupin domain-containing protein n=1 Tax=Cohnella sp. TaxID=1883426 RepID=UPI003568FE22